jgi:hypothetical protein
MRARQRRLAGRPGHQAHGRVRREKGRISVDEHASCGRCLMYTGTPDRPGFLTTNRPDGEGEARWMQGMTPRSDAEAPRVARVRRGVEDLVRRIVAQHRGHGRPECLRRRPSSPSLSSLPPRPARRNVERHHS